MSLSTFSRRVIAIGATAVLAIGLAGCGAITTGTEPSGDGSFQLADHIQQRIDDGEELRIKLSYHDPSLAFATPISVGMERAGDEFDVDVQLIGPTGGDAAKQVAELQTAIQQKSVDGLAVSSASSDALKPVIEQAYNAGIPIISFNTDNPDSQQMGFVGQDLRASGTAQAEELLSELGDGATGTVMVFSLDTGAGWSHDRFGGFEEGLAGSGLDIVGPVNVGNEPSAAYNTVESTMAGQSDVVAIAGLDCCSTTAAAQWVQQSGNTGKITMVGFDLLPQTAEFVESGVVTFTISQNPEEQGYQAVKTLVELLKDGTEITGVDTGAQFINLGNLNDATVEG